jgi:tetratricopeptide (TPR) repeat protein
LVLSLAAGWWWTRPDLGRVLERGRDALAAGELAKARSEAQELRKLLERPAFATHPLREDCWRFVADAHEADGDLRTAVSAWERVADIAPDVADEARFKLGSLFLRQYRGDAAERVLTELLARRPDMSDAWRLLAQLRGARGESTELAVALARLAQLGVATADDLEVLAAPGAFVTDEATIDKLLAAEPNCRRPLLARVRAALNRDDNAEALRLARELVAAHPEHGEGQALLGRLLAEVSSREFLEWHARIPQAASGHPQVWLTRGLWLRAQGELDPAIRCFREAMLVEPENLAANKQLSECLQARAEQPLADRMARRVATLREIVDLAQRFGERPNPALVRQIVPKLEATGRYWEARAWLELLVRAGTVDVETQRDDLKAAAQRTPTRTDPAAIPGADLDWSRIPLPDWTRYVPREALARGSESAARIRFVNEAREAGLDFAYRNSDDPATPGRRIFESTGGGVAFLDYDRDGRPDLYWTQGGPWPVDKATSPTDELFRNTGDRGPDRKPFRNVTKTAGIDERMFSQGVAAGDIDNDGFPDLYVANIGRNTLFRNRGDGTFDKFDGPADFDQAAWTVSVAIADFDGDSVPDLFDVNYLQGEAIFTTICVDDEERPRVCRPSVFQPATDTVWRGAGDGRFSPKQSEAGLELPDGMGLGLIVARFDDDARPDVFVANDQTPNYLLVNDGSPDTGPRFVERGMESGVGLDREGFAQACMGVASADVNRDGRVDLFVTNFAKESNTLYLSLASGGYQDETRPAGLRAPSFDLLGFGTQFLDADHDGWHDLFVGNGHIDEFSHLGQDYRMRSQFFRGLPDGRFVESLADEAGSYFGEKRLSRGVALGDWNRDGLADLAVSDLDQPAALLTNRTEGAGHWLEVVCVGTTSARDAVGTRVRVSTGDGVLWGEVTAGSGYEASNESVVRFGLGTVDLVGELEITWPDGSVFTQASVAADQRWVARQGSGQLVSSAKPDP